MKKILITIILYSAIIGLFFIPEVHAENSLTGTWATEFSSCNTELGKGDFKVVVKQADVEKFNIIYDCGHAYDWNLDSYTFTANKTIEIFFYYRLNGMESCEIKDFKIEKIEDEKGNNGSSAVLQSFKKEIVTKGVDSNDIWTAPAAYGLMNLNIYKNGTYTISFSMDTDEYDIAAKITIEVSGAIETITGNDMSNMLDNKFNKTAEDYHLSVVVMDEENSITTVIDNEKIEFGTNYNVVKNCNVGGYKLLENVKVYFNFACESLSDENQRFSVKRHRIR